jgi:hypothetical protein
LTTSTGGPAKRGDRRYLQKLWVPVVLAVGFVTGEAISYGTEMPGIEERGGPFGGHFHPFPTNPVFSYHVILATMEVALLLALVVVYGRMYLETKANFSLGLIVVLIALLVQTLVSNPILEDLMGTPPLGPGYLTPAADILTICAYAIFLYLSLE